MDRLKRNSVLVITTLLILGTGFAPFFSNAAADKVSNSQYKKLEFTKNFSKPILKENKGYMEISVEETNSFITKEKKPKIPFLSKTYEFPLGTKIINIELTHSVTKTTVLVKHVAPVPVKQRIDNKITAEILNQEIYNSFEPYPNEWFRITTGAGLNKENDHVLILSMHLFPVRYLSMEKSIQYVEQMRVRITYEEPEVEKTNSDVYDLVIIAPSVFSEKLQPLVLHKNNCSIETNLVTLEEIYSTFPGRDDAEKIKYFIKYAVEEWNIHYVLLVGDIKKLPIRRTYASWWEPHILSDLYYADIYDSEYRFCSWDLNKNDRFGEMHEFEDIDGVDLYPDVHVGRLACRDENEVEVVVDKIINYEKETYDQIWFKKIVLAGGDTFPPSVGGLPFVYEGEITNIKVAQQLPDFEHVKLWASKHNLNAKTFNREISKGTGFVSYSGHGFEHGWGTYRPNSLRYRMGFTQPLYYTPFIKFLRNRNKLPIIFFDACLTAKLDFNITDLYEYYPFLIISLLVFTKLRYDPAVFYPCLAWSFVKEKGGGAIATVGATRTAYTWVDRNGVYAGAGYLNVHFFKAYEEGVTAGEMLSQAQKEYINNVGRDYFTIEEFILLGDPSLIVGGYHTT